MKSGTRVASDVGGTFTDSVAFDETRGVLTISKVATTPADRARGTIAGLRRALSLQGADVAPVSYVGHGMTTGTNAVIQRTGARTAFLTNDGFRDLLLIGRQNRPSLFDLTRVRPPQLVPRELCFTVRGRMNHKGQEITPLDETALEDVARQMRDADVEALAIMFLHSYANPQHEVRAKAVLEALLPEVLISTSVEVIAEFREFERGSTTVLNAFLRPVMDRYLGSLSDMLADEEHGLALPDTVPVMIMEASGGLMSMEAARLKPVNTVLSGPAGGVVAAGYIAGLIGIEDAITMDMGGTSTDISMIAGGRAQVTRSAELEAVPIRLPVIDINAIGAGGGSIAWIDAGGGLRVGPQSAESQPGPACYRRGGTLPTLTDANLVLGRLSPSSRLGGDLGLSEDLAHEAIRIHIAEPLGMDVTHAAAGILRVAHAAATRGIRVMTVERGHDPRRFALMPFGGAGPMHASPIARELGMSRIVVPPAPGILCALGQLVSDLRHDFLQSCIRTYENLPISDVRGLVGALTARAEAALDADHVASGRRVLDTRVDLRYAGQSYELTLPLADCTSETWDGLPAAFHAAHRQRFGHADPDAPMEIVSFGVTAIGRIDPPKLPELPAGDEAPVQSARLGERWVHFESHIGGNTVSAALTAVYRRDGLLAGNRIVGPAVIDELSATVILYPGDSALVHPTGTLVIEVGA